MDFNRPVNDSDEGHDLQKGHWGKPTPSCVHRCLKKTNAAQSGKRVGMKS